MEKGLIQTELKNLSVLETDFRDSFRPGNVFGLGKSHYSPGSGTATVKVYSKTYVGRLAAGGSFVHPGLSPKFTHESAHCLLTNHSLAGARLRTVETLRNGLCLLIVRKMLEQHNRIWIPVAIYLNEEHSNTDIKRLVRILNRLTDLERKLIDGWKLGQEMFAFAYTILACGMSEIVSRDIFGIGEQAEMVRAWRLLGQFLDDKVVRRVAQQLQAFCIKQGMVWSDLKRGDLMKLAHDADAIFGEDAEAKAAFLGWLEVIPKLQQRKKPDTGLSDDEIYGRLRKGVTDEYGKSGNEHLLALNILTTFYDPVDVYGLIIRLPITAFLFTPRVPPSVLVEEETRIATFDTVDEADMAVKDLLKRNPVADLVKDAKHAQRFLRELMKVQRNSGWVALADKSVKDRDICGTNEWAKEVARLAVIDKQGRKLLCQLIDGQSTPEGLLGHLASRAVSEHLSFIPNRILLGLGLAVAKRLRKRIQGLDVWFSVLDELKVRRAGDFGKLLSRYGEGLVSLVQTQRNKVVAIPPAIYEDREGLKLVVPGDGLRFLTHSFWFYLVGELCDICIQGKENYTLVCPCGRMMQVLKQRWADGETAQRFETSVARLESLVKDCGPKHLCGIKKGLSRLRVPGSLICGNSQTAQHVHFFRDGQLHRCGEIPFEVFLVDNNKSRKAAENDFEEDIGSHLSKILLGGEKTDRTAKERKEALNKTFREIRRNTSANLKRSLTESGYSRFTVAVGVFLVNFFLLGFYTLIFTPLGIASHSAAFIYRAVIFPQKKIAALRRRRRIKAAQTGWGTVVRELNYAFQKLSQ